MKSLVAAALALAASPAVAGPPTAEASLTYSHPSSTVLRVCASGAVDDGATVVGVWQFSAALVRADGTDDVRAVPIRGDGLPLTCFLLDSAGSSGAGAVTVSFTGATTGGDVTTLCSALLTFTASAFPAPLASECLNPNG